MIMITSVSAVALSKTYGKTTALNGLSLKIESGSIYGLIGANGAGKTTSLAILAGLIKPDSGTAWILGKQVQPGCCGLASRVGFSSPQFPLFDYLTGLEVLSTCGLMHGLRVEEVEKRTHDLLELMDLQSAAFQYICHYSQGMRQKIGLACALIHAPEVLLLDEPFLGLDPASNYRLICILEQMAAKGQTIIVSSHNMALVERLCSRVGILHKGVLQREIAVTHTKAPNTATQSYKDASSQLAAAFWDVVGLPEPMELSWI
jgi:ABC-2 type transport system ATP-binding protein